MTVTIPHRRSELAAFLRSRRGRISNTVYAAMWPQVLEDERGSNLLWSSFTTPECCSTFVNRDQELPQMVATFRTSFGRHLGEPAWIDLIQRLSAASPEFERLWAAHDVAVPTTRVKVFRHHAAGEVRMSVVGFAVVATSETRMAVYTAADEESRERLRRLAEHPAAASLDPAHHHTH